MIKTYLSGQCESLFCKCLYKTRARVIVCYQRFYFEKNKNMDESKNMGESESNFICFLLYKSFHCDL